MYGLPKDLDLSFLRGVELLQVCIGAYQIILNFNNDVSIAIEGDYRVSVIDGDDRLFEDTRDSAGALVKFISDSISEVHGLPDGTLRLVFAANGEIELYDSSEHYESYQITHGDAIHIV